ncbi:MAG TPA: hypothetical protein VFW11_17535, partial [Cyclobacteriaceae bacterium]|nr:hypothetical protein [Cyclobacteriaceae bacterium]
MQAFVPENCKLYLKYVGKICMWPKRKYKVPSFIEDLQTRPFELQVWCVITAIAALRTLKAVVQ